MSRQVCQLCGYDDDVVEFVDDEDPDQVVLMCEGPSCGRYTWRPTKRPSARDQTQRTGIGEQLGVYDDLLVCVGDSREWLEYGIIEHRYKQLNPAAYAAMVQRWGHTAKARTKYSASSFLGSCLAQLGREGLIAYRRAPTTGYWSYLSAAGHAAALPAPAADEGLSWAEFAEAEGLDPDQWSL